MKTPSETPYTLLTNRIAELKFDKSMQEVAIATAARSILESLQPAQLAREAVIELAQDRDLRVSTTQTALKMSTRFLVYKVLGRFGGVVGAVGAAVAGKASDKYMNYFAPRLLSLAGSLFNSKKQSEKSIDAFGVY